MKEVLLKKSSNSDKKYDAIGEGKKISFGASGYSDFTKHKDPERKERYIERHKKNEDWKKLNAGSFSRYILWNKPTITASIRDMEKRFNIDIKYKK